MFAVGIVAVLFATPDRCEAAARHASPRCSARVDGDPLLPARVRPRAADLPDRQDATESGRCAGARRRYISSRCSRSPPARARAAAGSRRRAGPWYVRDLPLPAARAVVLARRYARARPFHLACQRALLRYCLRPRLVAGRRRRAGSVGAGCRPSDRVLPDGSDARIRDMRYIGPGTALVARGPRSRRRDVRSPRVRCGEPAYVRLGRPRGRLRRGRVVALPTGSRLTSASTSAATTLRAPLTSSTATACSPGDRRGWAAFALETSSYAWLSEDVKRAPSCSRGRAGGARGGPADSPRRALSMRAR